jgi:hypothetical protein
MEQIGEAPVPLPEDVQLLGRQFGQQADLAPLDVRLQHVRGRQVGLGRQPRLVHSQQIVQDQDVVATPDVPEDRQQPLLPLPHKRHARDQPLRRQQPVPAAVVVRVPDVLLATALFRDAIDDFVDQVRLADQRWADQQHRPIVGRCQKGLQFPDQGVPLDRPVQPDRGRKCASRQSPVVARTS